MNIVLKLSKLCNLRCSYCYEYDQLANPARMPLSGLAQFFESLATWLDSQQLRVGLEVALHGGEPLLLPPDYLRAVVDLQRRALGGAGHQVRNTVQSNLYRVRDDMLACLQELDIGLGVSIDVHGAARVDARGRCAEPAVDRNLRRLLDSGLAERITMGGISVLHAGNVEQAVATYHYFAELGLNYRILPIFAMEAPGPRMTPLMLSAEQIVDAFRAVMHARLVTEAPAIRVEPLDEYLQTAGLKRRNQPRPPSSQQLPWSLIVDTQGDAYLHADAYSPGGRLGNVFTQPFGELMASSAYAQALAAQRQRLQVCTRCTWEAYCTRLPVAEALHSERMTNDHGEAVCAIAQPFLSTLDEWMRQAA